MKNQLFRSEAMEYRYKKSGSPVIIDYKFNNIFYMLFLLILFLLTSILLYSYVYRPKINMIGYVGSNKEVFELMSNTKGFILYKDVKVGHKFSKGDLLYKVSSEIEAPYFVLHSSKSVFPLNANGVEIRAPIDGISVSEGYKMGDMISKGDKLLSFIDSNVDLGIEARNSIDILPFIKTGMTVHINEIGSTKIYESTITDILSDRCENRICKKDFFIKVKIDKKNELELFMYNNIFSRVEITVDLEEKHIWN